MVGIRETFENRGRCESGRPVVLPSANRRRTTVAHTHTDARTQWQTIDYQKNTTREEKGIVERTLEENAAVFTARWKEGEAALQSADSTSVEHRRSST
ncbi:hypothetical protein T4B_4758 [Trichinella pseudospiralis]|uniref:Uncharacterized protein n=1 Tax=Trichinella pseudospiralis TaxID=6337 RepID=A0A0V1GXF7_TRIPS|nr:hypothetical protein T4A_5642 [Trichinella pseudospiralis]KRZ02741.1 hypothetical protein T4B_4758 [Trichinella pseudospiralis]KRZ20927.1 hypothetical protein T4C_4538 [Trichinella pseudospiralis]